MEAEEPDRRLLLWSRGEMGIIENLALASETEKRGQI